MFRRLFPYLVGVLIGAIASTTIQPTVILLGLAQGQPGCQTFRETGKTVCGRFLQYWQQNGGLPQQGYPISNTFVEVSELNGKPYTVQYFERAVFEHHPENQPPHDVLLSQLGTFQFKRKYPGGEPGGSQQPPVQPTQAPPPTQSTQAAAVEVRGNGSKVSDPITLNKGLAVFRSVHTNGRSNFIVELVDMNGRAIELLANEIGPAEAMTADHIPATGQYLLKVRADGDWVVTITQPKASYSTPPARQEWRGTGPFVTPLFSLKAGAVRINASHTNGRSNFIVRLLDQEGNPVELIANEIGPAVIETIENIPRNGVYVLVIDADGEWSVTLQQ